MVSRSLPRNSYHGLFTPATGQEIHRAHKPLWDTLLLQGSFSHSLAEYTLAACNWFAKDFPRLRAQQKAKKWEPFDVEELRNKTMGVVGYGDIGQAAARIARAFGMKIIALRRNPELSDQEKQECLTVSLALTCSASFACRGMLGCHHF